MSANLIRKPINFGKRLLYRLEKWLYYTGLLKATHFTFPDFICIGSEKAGTTWLYENLRCHPELFLPDRKELNYFSSKYRFYGMPLNAYSDYFKNAHGIKGEVTPCANLPCRRIRFIKKIMPDVKLILIIRKPVERMWASALMHLVSAQKKTYENIKDEEFYRLFRDRDLFSRGDYPTILNNWRRVFPPEQFHICFYTDLNNDPETFLKGIFRFLGVSEDVNYDSFPVDKVFNKSPAYPCPEHLRSYLKDIYRDSIHQLSREFPKETNGWL